MINKGDPINPQSLVGIIKDKYRNIIDTLKTLIPLGFNSRYTITGDKSFTIRPKVINGYYSSRTGSDITDLDANVTQPNIGVAFLGSPWTYQIGEDFGLGNYTYSSLGDITQPFIKYSPKVAINPTSDLIGGIPRLGNSPFIWNGHLALSNSFEDTNVRAYVTEDGSNVVVEAKSISLLYTPIQGNTYGEETILLGTNIALSRPINDYIGTVNKPSNPGDYYIMLRGTSVNGGSGMVPSLRLASAVDETSTQYGLFNTLVMSDGTTIKGFIPNVANYERPLFLVHFNGTNFRSSKITAWNESVDTVNSSHFYGKQYQQSTTEDTQIRLETVPNDRRLVPAHYYLSLNSNALVDSTCYNGVVRDLPSLKSQGNQVYIENVGASSEGVRNVRGHIKQIALSNGTSTLWLKNLVVEELPLHLMDNFTLSLPNYNGQYLWLVARVDDDYDNRPDTTAILGNGSSLLYSLVQTTAHSWEDEDGFNGLKSKIHFVPKFRVSASAPDKDNIFRCRIGYLGKRTNNASSSSTIDANFRVIIENEKHFFPDVNMLSIAKRGLNIGTGTTPGGAFKRIDLSLYNMLLPLKNVGTLSPGNGIVTGTKTLATSIDVLLTNRSGTASTGTNYVSVLSRVMGSSLGLNLSSGTAMPVNFSFDDPTDPFKLSYNVNSPILSGPPNYSITSNVTMPLDGVDDDIYYAAIGADGDTIVDRTFKSALITGFTLPYAY